MQRTSRAAILLGALFIALATTAQARQTIDGTYTGPVARSSMETVVEVLVAEATVTVANGTVTGIQRFEVLDSPDYGEYVTVVFESAQRAEFTGPIAADGSFSVPGSSSSSIALHSCEGGESNCNNIEVSSGHEGVEVTVVGQIDSGVMTAGIFWPGNDQPTFSFTATNPDYAAPTTSTIPQTTTTFTIPDIADPTAPGVQVIGDIVYINSPPGEVLELAGSDLPIWAGVILAREGDMVVRVGAPSSLVGGDQNVLLNGKPVIRQGDATTTGGVVVVGSDRIVINGVPAAVLGSMVVDPGVNPGAVPAVGGPIATTSGCQNVTIAYDLHPVCGGGGITSVASPTAAGDTRLEVTDDTIQVGDGVVIGSDPDTMEARIVVDEGSLILDRPLDYAHNPGEMVARIPQQHVADAFGTAPPDESTPWLGIVALLAAIGLGTRGFMVWRRGRVGTSGG